MSSDKNDLWFESKVIKLNIFRQIDAHENQLSFRFLTELVQFSLNKRYREWCLKFQSPYLHNYTAFSFTTWAT
jgi:hypothetical protein